VARGAQGSFRFFLQVLSVGPWLVTGESRACYPTVGCAGGVAPKRRVGAVELVLRYSHLNISDDPIDGGVPNKWHYGVNWWASIQCTRIQWRY